MASTPSAGRRSEDLLLNGGQRVRPGPRSRHFGTINCSESDLSDQEANERTASLWKPWEPWHCFQSVIVRSRARITILIGTTLGALSPIGGPIQDPVLTLVGFEEEERDSKVSTRMRRNVLTYG